MFGTGVVVWAVGAVFALRELWRRPALSVGALALLVLAWLLRDQPGVAAVLAVLTASGAGLWWTLRFLAQRPPYAMAALVVLCLVAASLAAQLALAR